MQLSVAVALLLLEIIESAEGLLQLAGFSCSRHPSHLVTGHFYNSGPYACFLAVAFPLTLWMAFRQNNKLQMWVGTGMAVVAAVLIPATMSRTALVACAAGSCVSFAGPLKEMAGRLSSGWRAVLVVAFIAGGIGIYSLKKDSADGRVLMWRVAAQAALDAPVDGVGWDKVAGTYGEAQENYFASGGASGTDMLVADAPEYVFNEYLQVSIAFGIPAALGMIAIIIGGIVVAMRAGAYGYAGGATAVAIVMMASYPLQFPLFVIAIGLMLAGCYLSSRSRAVNIIATAVIAGSCTFFLTHNQTVDVRTGFSVGHSLHKMKEYRKSNANLLPLLAHSSDPMLLNIIGKNYQALGMPDSAEYYLNKSVNRCPNRLYPHYLLMRLHADTSSFNREAMMREAEIVATKQEKIPSPAVEEMRAEAREILSKQNKIPSTISNLKINRQ